MENLNLDEMRNQIAALKEQINNQQIVSDRLLSEVMKTKSKTIRSTRNLVYGAAIFCIILYPFASVVLDWSWAFSIATVLMVLFCMVATYYIHRPVDQLNFLTDDLATVARVMSRFKKQYHNWLCYIAPALLIPWLTWACYELGFKRAPEGTNPWLMCIPLAIGAIIGAAIGLYYHFKAVNAAQSIISQIEGE